MIRMEESQIAQILPECLAKKAEVRALSYALHRSVDRLVGYCGNIGVFSAIDTVPEYVLDMLALDLDTQYYDDSLPVQAKRVLVRNTLAWHMRAGTPASVEELVRTVFGRGEVREWFQYGGNPFMFRIITNADATYESIEKFEKLIERVKNVRSHIDEIIFAREHEIKINFAVASIARASVSIGWRD